MQNISSSAEVELEYFGKKEKALENKWAHVRKVMSNMESKNYGTC